MIEPFRIFEEEGLAAPATSISWATSKVQEQIMTNGLSSSATILSIGRI